MARLSSAASVSSEHVTAADACAKLDEDSGGSQLRKVVNGDCSQTWEPMTVNANACEERPELPSNASEIESSCVAAAFGDVEEQSEKAIAAPSVNFDKYIQMLKTRRTSRKLQRAATVMLPPSAARTLERLERPGRPPEILSGNRNDTSEQMRVISPPPSPPRYNIRQSQTMATQRTVLVFDGSVPERITTRVWENRTKSTTPEAHPSVSGTPATEARGNSRSAAGADIQTVGRLRQALLRDSVANVLGQMVPSADGLDGSNGAVGTVGIVSVTIAPKGQPRINARAAEAASEKTVAHERPLVGKTDNSPSSADSPPYRVTGTTCPAFVAADNQSTVDAQATDAVPRKEIARHHVMLVAPNPNRVPPSLPYVPSADPPENATGGTAGIAALREARHTDTPATVGANAETRTAGTESMGTMDRAGQAEWPASALARHVSPSHTHAGEPTGAGAAAPRTSGSGSTAPPNDNGGKRVAGDQEIKIADERVGGATRVVYVIPELTPPAIRLVLRQRSGWSEWDAAEHGPDEVRNCASVSTPFLGV